MLFRDTIDFIHIPQGSDNASPGIISIPLSTTNSITHFRQVYGRLRIVVIILRGLFVEAVLLPITTCRQRRRRSLFAILMRVSLHDWYLNAYREISHIAFDLGNSCKRERMIHKCLNNSRSMAI